MEWRSGGDPAEVVGTHWRMSGKPGEVVTYALINGRMVGGLIVVMGTVLAIA
jgi:hypothetical protein